MADTDSLVVFDRRGVDFLPPFQLAAQTAKFVDTVVVDGACSWRHLRQLPLASRVTRSPPAGAVCRWARYTPLMLPERDPLRSLGPRVNGWILRRDLRSIIGLAGRRAVIFDNCSQLPLVGTLGETASAYYLYDDFGVDLTGRPHGHLDRRMEARMLAAVDIVFAVSQRLCDYAAAHARNVHYLPNGYNADLFVPRPRPATTTGRKPVIGYSGVISGRVDLVGLLATAVERPDWEFRLLGRVEPTLAQELERTGRPRDLFESLCALPNVRLLNSRPIAEVPEVVADFDVAIVPYCLNDFTLASSPLKVYEYYAMGIPVVSTRIPEVLRFDPLIATVDEGGSYAVSIAAALQASETPSERQRRLDVVRPHSTFVRARDVIAELFPEHAA